jgi:hypothetical protein
MTPNYADLDDALVRLRPYGTALTNGFTSHAPMVAEALSALGRNRVIAPWIDDATRTHIERAPAGVPIDPDLWQAALGTRQRFADWSCFFEGELEKHPWADVVALWAVRLVPGICSDATHGAIRVGHAVRALGVNETPIRITELADALASWADTYQVLPSAPHDGDVHAPDDALARVQVIPAAERKAGGSIVAALMQLDDHPGFAPVINYLDVPTGSPDEQRACLLDLTSLFARVAVANIKDFSSAIVFVHSVTALVALLRLLPRVPAAAMADAIRYGWQASAALYAVYGLYPAAAPSDCRPVALEPLIERAVASGDDHAIKFSEACHALNALRPDPAFGSALEAALVHLAPS